MKAPREDDFITNSDASHVVPDENPEPLKGVKTDEPDTRPAKSGTSEGEKDAAAPSEKKA